MIRYFTKTWVVMLSYTGLSRVITGTTTIIICIQHVDITFNQYWYRR